MGGRPLVDRIMGVPQINAVLRQGTIYSPASKGTIILNKMTKCNVIFIIWSGRVVPFFKILCFSAQKNDKPCFFQIFSLFLNFARSDNFVSARNLIRYFSCFPLFFIEL